MEITSFEWDDAKNIENLSKHKISFELAKNAFFDSNRIIAFDKTHSTKNEKRYFCFAKLDNNVITVRFTQRKDKIRIFGAGYWRKGKKIYEKEN